MDHREFPWYPVWVIAIKDWMFPNSSTATVACNIAPQYVLRHTDIDNSLSSPNSGSVVKVTRKSVIPDFALLLQHVRTASNGTPILGSQKVVLIVENKPTQARSRYLRLPCPFMGINGQIGQQALFAFTAHPNLHMIGVVVAFGARWRYVEAVRPGSALLKKWIKYGDPSYAQSKKKLAWTVPEELQKLSPMKDHSFELLDHMGLTAQAFEFIAQRIKSRERTMWNL
ncbi:hypothetical protein K503DRAFT_773404 [Rhizopogon vinicolor AM-OR11-026]|uniref:Uncharacterized protein n=1 Tax=Rhizopogon vinicolor AM-OR11-026 TaxID=1314800 RepID=A0A1B7MSE0_9AGAM|nr:hypothetical protein K503DRAFT_773404 [Rhizopogon vinicolor AM-OR11-026]